MNVELIAIQPGEADKAWIVERAARICYRSKMSETKEEQTRFLKSLFDKAHTSIAEHARYVYIEVGNPYKLYWKHRYGVNITAGSCFDYHHIVRSYLVSSNARNIYEYSGRNPVTDWVVDDTPVQYDEMSDSEKLAHASATFEIDGISRACSHQLVRHRTFSVSQQSQRYCDAGDWEPVVPPSIANLKLCEVKHTFQQLIDDVKYSYEKLRKFDISKQDARFVLPNAAPTKMMVTATFENWLHFLKLRCDKAAQWEIRAVANEIARQLAKIEPKLFSLYESK